MGVILQDWSYIGTIFSAVTSVGILIVALSPAIASLATLVDCLIYSEFNRMIPVFVGLLLAITPVYFTTRYQPGNLAPILRFLGAWVAPFALV